MDPESLQLDLDPGIFFQVEHQNSFVNHKPVKKGVTTDLDNY